MTHEELEAARLAGATIYAIAPDGRRHIVGTLHLVPKYSCPPERYEAMVPFELAALLSSRQEVAPVDSELEQRRAADVAAEKDHPPHFVWECKIGGMGTASLPAGCDWPMRQAVSKAFAEIVGRDEDFLFSGWGAKLTEGEMAVHENRLPRGATITVTTGQTSDAREALQEILRVHANDNHRPKAFYIAAEAIAAMEAK